MKTQTRALDNYDYRDVDYIVDLLNDASVGWRFENSTTITSHSEYAGIGRNDYCPCGSGIKYKKCCLNEEGVKGTHTQFYLEEGPE